MEPSKPLDVARLLDDLCVRLGFCLAPEERARLCEAPPQDVDSFTDAVFRAEHMDPPLDGQLRQRVRELVAQAFRR